jgi:hypothetical protein
MFSVCSSTKNCPSARCASAANVRGKVDAFGMKIVSLDHIYNGTLLIIKILIVFKINVYVHTYFFPSHNGKRDCTN